MGASTLHHSHPAIPIPRPHNVVKRGEANVTISGTPVPSGLRMQWPRIFLANCLPQAILNIPFETRDRVRDRERRQTKMVANPEEDDGTVSSTIAR